MASGEKRFGRLFNLIPYPPDGLDEFRVPRRLVHLFAQPGDVIIAAVGETVEELRRGLGTFALALPGRQRVGEPAPVKGAQGLRHGARGDEGLAHGRSAVADSDGAECSDQCRAGEARQAVERLDDRSRGGEP